MMSFLTEGWYLSTYSNKYNFLFQFAKNVMDT